MAFQQEISFSTSGPGHIENLTGRVEKIIKESGVTKGIVNVFHVGSTGAVGTIEFEPGLNADLPEILNTLAPPGRTYAHEKAWHDGNGHSHIQATLLGASVTLPVRDGRPALGTWQQIFHLECDTRARERKVIVTVLG